MSRGNRGRKSSRFIQRTWTLTLSLPGALRGARFGCRNRRIPRLSCDLRSQHCQSQAPVPGRFLKSVVFKSFTLFRTFPLFLPKNPPRARRGKRPVNARG
jgi:hypothetical protein